MTFTRISAAGNRALLSLTTIPNRHDSLKVAIITISTAAAAGLFAKVSGFIDPIEDFDPPWRKSNDDNTNYCRRHFHWSAKPISAFFFPSLAEEILWRGVMIAPHPSTLIATDFPSHMIARAGIVLGVHVLLHPVAGYTVWPRGRKVFSDWRFLVLATIVLGGATSSYITSGGSVWAAALTHGLPVALWRDFFGGESMLMSPTIEDGGLGEKENSENDDVDCKKNPRP
mmetsp:Transcript_1948/g.4109  ORF Transcript_1948/g.4109 Transcript_1948/m.4109 type:complete len:228 (+) Transcript_1948:285-968(+)|eukprot:CAMPEP_0201129918 /NCGR_PEP_ID=MMETSP0850-20130426/38319_1 /ASSEMBLY_ACC=CAM_ASM_000622 /TAXON_ID=183588 /ORGANISM="Pseudo-nitzschia fraudulenta, Strain WWA7" /LENGTH=227 /DNA_ID=CAMNT_0047399521 /DNA_START=282 /DNA_END=965 /DNA_ORIENTATION=-